jgi:hypothetical protein
MGHGPQLERHKWFLQKRPQGVIMFMNIRMDILLQPAMGPTSLLQPAMGPISLLQPAMGPTSLH